MAKAINRSLPKTSYTERHHIIPKCIDKMSTITVRLLPEEHFTAHQLLIKIFPANSKLIYAAKMMTISASTNSRTNKLYGWLRRQFASAVSSERIRKPIIWTAEMRLAQSIRKKGKGVKHTDQTKQKLKLAAQQPRSLLQQQQAKSLGIANRGRIASEETRAKMRASHKNRAPITEAQREHLIQACKHRAPRQIPEAQETKAKRIESNKKASADWPLETCPHCEKEGRGPAMKRYHFSRCKILTSKLF